MKPITRFALEKHDGPYETWPLRSRLSMDGKPTDISFLPPGGGEPHGYDEFMATVDALIIGRKTFETVLTLGTWAYGEKPVFVLSTRPLAPAPRGAVVERMSGTQFTFGP